MKQKTNNSLIELFRIIAIFFIVLYHSGAPWGDFWYSGLVYFLIISFFFAVRSEDNFASLVKIRARRILLPWLFWSIIYFPINKKITSMLAGDFSIWDWFLIILSGTSIHLWYLPFVYIFGLAASYFVKKSRFVLCVMTFIMVGCIISVNYWRNYSISIGYPWAQWIHAFPAIICAVVFYEMVEVGWRERYLILILILSLLLYFYDVSGFGVTYFIGVLMAFGCIFWGGKFSIFSINKLSECSFGVYLMHPLFIKMVSKIINPNAYFLGLLAFIASLICVYFCKKKFPKFSKIVM